MQARVYFTKKFGLSTKPLIKKSDLDDYVQSKVGTFDVKGCSSDALDTIFCDFNADNRPNTGERSLSVGDVVELIENGHSVYYVVEAIGWSKYENLQG